MSLDGWGSGSGTSRGVLTNSAMTSPPPAGVAASGGLAAGFRSAAVPASTRTAYAGDWAKFSAWCSQEDHTALPADPGLVGEYLAQAAALTDESGGFAYAPATLARWLADNGASAFALSSTASKPNSSVQPRWRSSWPFWAELRDAFAHHARGGRECVASRYVAALQHDLAGAQIRPRPAFMRAREGRHIAAHHCLLSICSPL